MSSRAGRGLLAPIALLSLAAGCQLLIGLDGGTPRDGGSGGGATGGATTSASSTSSSTSSSSTSATTSTSSSSTSTSSTTSTSSSSTSTSATTTSTTGTTTTTTGPRVLLLAGSPTEGTMGGAFAGSWTTTTISGAMTSDPPALAVVPATGQGVGLVHVATSNLLDYTVYDGATWSSFTQLHADVTLGPPAIVGSGSTAQLVYSGTNYNFYYESWSGSAWSAPTPAIVPSDAGSLCGPSAPSLALAGADLSMVFVNGICSGTINALYDSDLSGSSWQAATLIATNPSDTAAQRPTVTTPSSGPELVVAFIAQGTSQIYTSHRTNGTWSTPVLLTNGLTNDPVALAPVAGGGGMAAVMAYRGTDMKLYTSFFDGTSWATPTAAFSPNNVTVNAAPSVAKGIGGKEAEMGYVDGNGSVWHTRYDGTTWSTAVQVGTGTGFANVAIAGGP